MPQKKDVTNTASQDEFNYTRRKTSSGKVAAHIKELMTAAESNLNKLLKNPLSADQRQEVQKQLDKIQSLKLMVIPTKDGAQRYYSVADNAGGVTEKTCLISENRLEGSLRELARAQNYDEVMKNEIRINAILKHPKAGHDTEVQREAISLKIARLLGFQRVTDSTLVYHNTGNGRHPCLFVPFGEMDLMTQYIDNAKSMRGRIKQEYFQSVEDLGKYSAFFMLSSDPDFMGKNGQNKGVTREEPIKKLYLFDQVFMTTNNFGLDRAFNLVPTNFLSKLPNVIARHFMGRNKSVVNDSSFEEKIQGAIGILQKKEDIKNMFQEVSQANSNLRGDPIVKKLQKDAKDCLKSFNERIHSIEKLFPPVKVNGVPKQVGDLVKNHDNKNLELLKKSMLVTQLINKPKLYDKTGKPYRAPFFTNPSTRVKQVSIDDNTVTISFSRTFGPPLSPKKKALLEQQGFTISEDGKSASIAKEALLTLNENSYFKEQQSNIDLDYSYLAPKKIETLANTYNESSDRVLRLIAQVRKSPDKAVAIRDALDQLDLISMKNKGFVAHVKDCFLHEAMKVLILKHPDKKEEIENGLQLAKHNGTFEHYVKKQLNELILPTKDNSCSQFRTVLADLRKEQSLPTPVADSSSQYQPPRMGGTSE